MLNGNVEKVGDDGTDFGDRLYLFIAGILIPNKNNNT